MATGTKISTTRPGGYEGRKGYTMTKKTDRNYYALHWKNGFEFEYDYDTIFELDVRVCSVVAFKKKHDRDKYVDRWHSAESIPASIALKLAKYIGIVYIEEGHER